MKIVAGTSQFRLRGYQGTELPSAEFVPEDVTMQADPLRTTIQDAVVDVVEGVSVARQFLYYLQSQLGLPASIRSLEPQQAAVIGDRLIPPTGDFQIVEFRVQSPAGQRRYQLQFTGAGAPVTSTMFVDWAAGTLAANIAANVQTLRAGKAAGAGSQHLWTQANYAAEPAQCSATVNPDCILQPAQYAFTSFSRNSGHNFPGMLISPRHILTNKHVGAAGNGFIWRTPAGVFKKAVCTADRDLGFDLMVGYLGTAITDVPLMTLMPDAVSQYLPTTTASPVRDYGQVPTFGITANPSMGLGNTQHVQVFGVEQLVPGSYALISGGRLPTSLAPFYSEPYGGDSASPVLYPITQAGSIKLVYATSLATASGGPPSSGFITAITNAMNSLAAAQGDNTVYSPLVADLSAFTSF